MSELSATLNTSYTRKPLDLLLAGAAVGAPLAYLLLQSLRPYPGDVALKTAMCVVLAALAFRHRERLFAVALLCSAAGDAFLAIDGERLFVPGLASFLVTHVLYAFIFVRAAQAAGVALRGVRIAAALAVAVFAAAFAARLWPELGELTIPVLCYMVAIVTMAVLALRVRSPWAGVGAVLFVASDSLIALGKFLLEAPWIGPAVWITYAAAQILIAYALLVDQPRRIQIAP